jgi:hypothetical protein
MTAEVGTSAARAASPIAEEISPTSSPRPTTAESVESEKDAHARRVEDLEALQYWGFMVKPDKCGSDKLNRLLSGIAHYIVSFFAWPAQRWSAHSET